MSRDDIRTEVRKIRLDIVEAINCTDITEMIWLHERMEVNRILVTWMHMIELVIRGEDYNENG